MPEVVAALKATGCNESLVADIEKSMRGEGSRQANEPRTDADRAAVWLASELAAIIPTKDLLKATKSSGAMVAYFKRLIGERQARGEPVSKTDWNNELSSWGDEDFIHIFHERPDLANRLRKMLAEPVSVPKQSEPSGYAYRYRYGAGGTVLRFNSGEEVHGARPVEAVPFWFAPQPPQIPEGYRLQPISEFDAMMNTRMIPEGYKLVPKYTMEFVLRAMARNYKKDHSWDHLDIEACEKAADEIRLLRAMLEAAPEENK